MTKEEQNRISEFANTCTEDLVKNNVKWSDYCILVNINGSNKFAYGSVRRFLDRVKLDLEKDIDFSKVNYELIKFN